MMEHEHQGHSTASGLREHWDHGRESYDDVCGSTPRAATSRNRATSSRSSRGSSAILWSGPFRALALLAHAVPAGKSMFTSSSNKTKSKIQEFD